MTKKEFIDQIRGRLTGLNEADIQKALDFYEEAIDDRIEDGLTEDQAVSAVGTPEEIADKILMDTPLPKLVMADTATKPHKETKVWQIILIVLGAPVWLPIAIALGAVAISLAAVIVVVILSLIIAVVASALGGITCVFTSLISLIMGGGVQALMSLGGSMVIAGLGVLLFIPIKAGCVWLIELAGRGTGRIKQHFIQKRNSRM